MGNYKIESGIPIPAKPPRIIKSEYPWKKLKKGQSFIRYCAKGQEKHWAEVTKRNGNDYARRHDLSYRFDTRVISEGEVRVWRIELEDLANKRMK